MATQTYNAVVKLGGTVDSSFKGIGGAVNKALGKTQKDIRKTKTEQTKLLREINKNRKAGKDVSALERKYSALGNELERAKAKQNSLNRAQQVGAKSGRLFGQVRTAVLGISAAATIAGGAIFGMTKSLADQMDYTAKTSAMLGFGVTSFQEYEYAARRSGMSAQEFATNAQKGIRSISEAAQGLGQGRLVLEELGLDAETVAMMSPEEQLDVIADAMAGVESQTERMRMAVQLFGRSGAKMTNMLKGGSAGLAQLRKDARATGNVLGKGAAKDAEDYSDALLDVELAFGGVTRMVGAQLMPVVTDTFKQTSGWIAENREQISVWAGQVANVAKSVFPAIVQGVVGLGKGLWTLGSAINSVVQFIGGWENAALAVGVVMGAKLVASVLGVVSAIGGFIGSLSALGGVVPVVVMGIKSIGVAMMANPVGLIAAAIAGAAALIYSNWEPISGFFSSLWDGVSSSFGMAWDMIQTAFSYSPLGMIVKSWQPAIKWITSKFDWIGNAANKVKSFFGFGDKEDEEEKKRPELGATQHQIAEPPSDSLTQPFNTQRQEAAQRPQIGGAYDAQIKKPEVTQARETIKQASPVQQVSRTDARKVDNINVYAAPGQDAREIGQQTATEWGGDNALYDLAGA